MHALRQYVNISIIQGEEDKLWSVVEQEVKNLDNGPSALTFKTKNKKKQVGLCFDALIRTIDHLRTHNHYNFKATD